MNKHPISYRSGFTALALAALLTLAACATTKGPTLPAPIPVELEQVKP